MRDPDPSSLRPVVGLDDALGVLEIDLAASLDGWPQSLRAAVMPLTARGKRLRAVLMWTCAHASSAARDRGELRLLMCAVELLHAATLIHDDVIDGAVERRSCPTVHEAVGVAGALVAGDRLIAQALSLAAAVSVRSMSELSDSLQAMCDAQYREAEAAFDVSRTRDHVLEVTDGKTARLFEAACVVGCNWTSDDDREEQVVRAFGRHFGRGYQLRDDLHDLLDDMEDLRQGTITLPLVVTLGREEQASKLIHPGLTAERRLNLIELVHATGAVREAVLEANAEFGQAIALSRELPRTPIANALGVFVAGFCDGEGDILHV